jgi:hypothetical protein
MGKTSFFGGFWGIYFDNTRKGWYHRGEIERTGGEMMDWLWNFLWFAGFWIGGSFVIYVFGSQVGCCLGCTLPMIKRLAPYGKGLFFLNDYKAFAYRVIAINLAIIAAVTTLVFWLAPEPATWGYVIGLVVGFVFSVGSMGITEENVDDFVRVLQKFVVPGKDDEAFDALMTALRS